MILVPKKRASTKGRGKLIIIEGADGTGKATQADLLVKHLRKNKIRIRYYDFPQYDKTFFGAMVGEFLRGEYGSFKTLSPYLVSLPYALDRASVAHEMEDWLRKGGWIICNRYVSSHLAHQTAKIADPKEQKRFIAWIQRLEYEELGIPKEDRVICLHVPHDIASKLTLQKGSRGYLRKRKTDEAERDVHHQKTASDMYIKLAKTLRHWTLIRCIDASGTLLPIATIHKKIVQSLE